MTQSIVPSRLRYPAISITAVLLWLGIASADQMPAVSSRIVIHFQTIQRAIPALLFGQNLQTIERGEGLVREDGAIDPTFIALLNEARVTSLRFPGGTAADYFHWWQALGPFSSRPPQSSGYLNESYSPVVGPEEFIRAAKALRAVPFVTANSGTGSADETGALARFFNLRGFPAVFWEVGNEVYFEGLSESGLVGLPPDVYAKRVIAYVAAIRRESPEAKVFAAVVIGPEEQDSYWNRVVLGLAGPHIDGVSIHNAYFPLSGYLRDGTVPPDEYLFTAMLAATKAVDRTMTMIEEQLIRSGNLIPVFVTEYDGIFYPNPAVEPVSRTIQRNPTLGCALFNASVIHIMLRHQRVFGAHHMSLTGTRFGGLIGVDGAARYRTPQFYVHREYARQQGHLLVDTALDPQDARFSSGPIKLLSGQTDVPMLDAIATRDPAGTSYALFVVNRSLTAAVNTSVTLDVPAGLKGTVTTLTGASYTTTNNAAEPNRVAPVTAPFVGISPFSYQFPPHSLTVFRWTR